MKNKIQIETRSPCLESLFFHRALATVLLLAVPLLISCGGGGNSAASSPPPPPPAASAVSVTISPKNVNNLPAGGTQAFNATVTGSSNQAVIWSVREGAWCGSVTTSGTYLAPNSPGLVCHVVATSQADATKSDTAEIMVSPISMHASTGSMQKSRVGHSATLLANGKVLIAGGYVPACTECLGVPDNTAELYDPATGVFALTGSMAEVRAKHTATLLTSGQVLTAGGDPTGINGGGAGCTDCID